MSSFVLAVCVLCVRLSHKIVRLCVFADFITC